MFSYDKHFFRTVKSSLNACTPGMYYENHCLNIDAFLLGKILCKHQIFSYW